MKTGLQIILKKASAEQLIEIIESVYGKHKEIDHCIESLLLKNNPTELAKHLKKRIQSIKRGRRFIDYRESHEFSMILDAIVWDIAPLTDTYPKLAFDLADQLMATHSSVLDRVDDSNGSIGSSYLDAVDLWLRAASLWRAQDKKCKVNWQAELLSKHIDNDYGMWDTLIPNSASLLNDEELKQLAWRFEGLIKKALIQNNEESYNFSAARASVGLASVATALSDVEMYEHSVLLTSPQPNPLQKKSIIKFCLGVKDGNAALKWLNAPWETRFEADRLRLLDKTFALLGQTEELTQLRHAAYDTAPDFYNLQALLDILPEQDKAPLQDKAIEKALSNNDTRTSIDTLIALKAFEEAAQHTILQTSQLNHIYYDTLLDWAKSFHESGQYLATVACYRHLLEDILNAGRSKAYSHAARYYARLNELDAHIKNYQPFDNKDDYQTSLRQIHWRKMAFWRLVE